MAYFLLDRLAKSAGNSKSTGKKTSAAKKSTPAKQTTARYRRSTQKEPEPERYREIQHSLAEKGYFAGPVNGTWGPDSVDALKRFQRDQNLEADGKIGSLSLIALGLGPRRAAMPEPGSKGAPPSPAPETTNPETK